MRSQSKHSRSATLLKAALLSLAISSSACAASSQSQAQTRQLTEEQKDQIAQRLEETRQRLNLTEEQRAALEPVLRASFEKRAAILNKYGVSRDGGNRLKYREARAMQGELETVRNQTEKEVAKILDSRQMAEFLKIQEENRQAMRERIRSRR